MNFSEVSVGFSVAVEKKRPKKASVEWVDFWHIARSVGSGWNETSRRDVPRQRLSALLTYVWEVRHERGNLRGWMICAFQEACE